MTAIFDTAKSGDHILSDDEVHEAIGRHRARVGQSEVDASA